MLFESLIVYRLYSSRTLCHIKEKPLIVKKGLCIFFPLYKKQNIKKKYKPSDLSAVLSG